MKNTQITVAPPMSWMIRDEGQYQNSWALIKHNPKMQYFDSEHLNSQSVVITLEDLMNKIQTNVQSQKRCAAIRSNIPVDEKKHIKTNGLLRIFWGTFNLVDGKFKDDGLISHPGLMCFDVDKLDLSGAYFVKLALSGDPFVVAAWISPSANGVKFLVRTPASIAQHRHRYTGVKNYYSKLLNVALDSTCINPARACFMSSDPSPYINYNAEINDEICMADYMKQFIPIVKVTNNVNISSKWKAVENMMKSKNIMDSRHGYLSNYSALCNKVGIQQTECINTMQQKFAGNAFGRLITNAEIESLVVDRYTKFAVEFSTLKVM